MAWTASFDNEMIERLQRSRLPVPDGCGAPVVRLGEGAVKRLVTLLERADGLPAQDDRSQIALVHLLLSAWMEQRLASRIVHRAVRRAARILRARSRHRSLHHLAKMCSVSGSWLSRLFRLHVGVSVVDYRNHYRMGRFLDLCVYAPRRCTNVMDAAAKAGFGSYAQFHRVCRERLGCAPSQLVGHPHLSEIRQIAGHEAQCIHSIASMPM